MGLIAKSDGEKYELTPEGSHLARCYRLIDIGTQSFEYQGKPKKAHKILIGWELPMEAKSDGAPFQITKKYTVSLHEKSALRKDLEAWRGKAFTEPELDGFDLNNIMGKPCYINIAHKVKDDKTYANIKSIMALPKGVTCPEPINAPVVFDLDNYDAMVFNELSDGVKKLIEGCEEFNGVTNGGWSSGPTGDSPATHDDVPF